MYKDIRLIRMMEVHPIYSLDNCFPVNFLKFIHLGHFYSASSSSLLLRGAPDTAPILCRSFLPKRHRQLRVKDLLKVPTWRLEQDANPRPFERKATNLLMSHNAPQNYLKSFTDRYAYNNIVTCVDYMYMTQHPVIMMTLRISVTTIAL